jgi:hypothetical protein
MPVSYPWTSSFVAALLETNPEKLHERIEDAYHAISLRLSTGEPLDDLGSLSANMGTSYVKTHGLLTPARRPTATVTCATAKSI